MSRSTVVALSAMWTTVLGAVLAAVLVTGVFAINQSRLTVIEVEHDRFTSECSSPLVSSAEAVSAGDWKRADVVDEVQAVCRERAQDASE